MCAYVRQRNREVHAVLQANYKAGVNLSTAPSFPSRSIDWHKACSPPVTGVCSSERALCWLAHLSSAFPDDLLICTGTEHVGSRSTSSSFPSLLPIMRRETGFWRSCRSPPRIIFHHVPQTSSTHAALCAYLGARVSNASKHQNVNRGVPGSDCKSVVLQARFQLAAVGNSPGMCRSLIVETLFAVFAAGRRPRASTLPICAVMTSPVVESTLVCPAAQVPFLSK